MEYKLYRGYILGPGYQNPAYGVYETVIYRRKEDVIMEDYEAGVWHTSESEWEAQLWLDRESVVIGTATQADVDELNKKTVTVVPEYPNRIMDKVRQRLGLEPGDTSRDEEINRFTHDSVFSHCLQWEGIIGYEFAIKDWVRDIYGITLS